jgi:hypothetical protein
MLIGDDDWKSHRLPERTTTEEQTSPPRIAPGVDDWPLFWTVLTSFGPSSFEKELIAQQMVVYLELLARSTVTDLPMLLVSDVFLFALLVAHVVASLSSVDRSMEA